MKIDMKPNINKYTLLLAGSLALCLPAMIF